MMKRLIVTALIAASMATPAAGRPHPAIEGGPCNTWMSRVLPSMGFEKVHRRTLAEIRCAVHWVHGVPGGYAMAVCIAERESGPYTWPWADSGSSQGVFQFIPSTWASARATFRWLASVTNPSVFSMRSNVLFFARYAHSYGLAAWSGGC